MPTPVAAGMWEFRRNNMFAATAFSSYGGFWLGYGIYGVLASGETCSVPALNLSECSWRSSGPGDVCFDMAGWDRPLWGPFQRSAVLLHERSALTTCGSPTVSVGPEANVRPCLPVLPAVVVDSDLALPQRSCSALSPTCYAGGVIEQSGPRSIEMFLSLWGIFTFLYFM